MIQDIPNSAKAGSAAWVDVVRGIAASQGANYAHAPVPPHRLRHNRHTTFTVMNFPSSLVFPHTFVPWFRTVAPYIHAYRGKTFVVALCGEAIAAGKLASFVQDLAKIGRAHV